MKTEDLRALLADRAAEVDPTRPDRVNEVHERIHTARRNRVVGAGAAGVATLVVAVGLLSTVAGNAPRTQEPAQDPSPTPTSIPTPSETLEVGPGQVFVAGDYGQRDIQGWDDGVTHTTKKDPGATLLQKVVATRTLYFGLEGFCRGDQATWWVVTTSYGGMDYGQCSPDSPLSTPPPVDVSAVDPMSPSKWDYGTWSRWDSAKDEKTVGTETYWEPEVDMFVTSDLPVRVRRCIDRADIADECYSREVGSSSTVLKVLGETDATFGFTVFQELAPHVANVLGQGFEALAVVDGTSYLFSYAVEAPKSNKLTFDLPHSDQDRLVGVLGNELIEAELRVDGGPPTARKDSPFFGRPPGLAASALLPAGSHSVTAQLGTGNPNAKGLAIVVYERVS